MTTLRLISFPAHGVLELVLGIAALVAPFALGLGAAGGIVTVLAGTLLIGLALTAVEGQRIATHHDYDAALAAALGFAALAVGIAGDAPAAVTLAVLAFAQTALNLTTRYSIRG